MRRLEELEARLSPAAEPLVIIIDYVDTDGNVVDYVDVKVDVSPRHDPGLRRRRWRPWRPANSGR